MVKNSLLLIGLLVVLVSCIGSPITVQVAKDVNGDVVQEVGTIDTTTETAVSPPSTVEPPKRNWFALFIGVGIPTLLGVGLTLHLLGRKDGKNYWDNVNIDELSQDEYEIFLDWVKKGKY